MAITDLDILAQIQLALQEDPAFSSGLWTPSEVLNYLNQRQARFLKETGLLGAVATITWVPQETYQPLPPDWILTIRAAWHDLTTNVWTPLDPSDDFELDHADQQYGLTAGTPLAYRDADTPGTLMLGLGPAPSSVGEVELIYTALAEVLDGSGALFDTPDDFVPYIRYGVYADMLGKDGRGQDLLRARYAEQRFTEGVTLATSLLAGWP